MKMRNMAKRFLTMGALTVLMLAGSVFWGNSTKASAAVKCYTIGSGNTTVYSNTGLTKKYGTIYGSDQLTVLQVTDRYCRVTYPVSRGTKTGYISTKSILTKTTGSSYKSRAKITTYRRPGGSSYGYISSGDQVKVLGDYGSYKQVKYPVSGGYKYGFISSGICNSYILPGVSKKSGSNPLGYVDAVKSNATKKITVTGWAFDRDSLGSKLQIHVYVGGPAGSGAPGYIITANSYRPDVNNVYRGVGSYHGFNSTISVSKTGTQKVYLYAINVGGGNGNSLIGTKTVNIQGGNQTGSTANKSTAASIVNYELSQVGVGDKKGNNNVIYNTWYYGRTVSGSGYAWCMAFQAYCANRFGKLNVAIPRTASCTAAVNWYKNRGQFHLSRCYGGNYTPKAGDLVFYTSNRGGSSCHVGMITASPVNGYLQTVEGNIVCSDGNWKVVRFTRNAKRTVSNSYVYGYASPVY